MADGGIRDEGAAAPLHGAGAPRSMTGFAQVAGAGHGRAWDWDLRAVNGRGLELRLRVPDRPAGLEAEARDLLRSRIRRGTLRATCRLVGEDGERGALAVHPGGLDRALAALARVEAAARVAGAPVAAPSAAEVLALPGVLSAVEEEVGDEDALRAAMLADLRRAVEMLDAARAAEGAQAAAAVGAHLGEIERLVEEAASAEAARGDALGEALRAAVARAAAEGAGVPEERLAQELAVILSRSDAAEEIDRLRGHVAAARALLAGEGPHGRRLEFLAQEFLRESNTLCAKAATRELTAIGLALKAAVDRVREQASNVE